MNSSFDALNHDNARLRFEINKNVLNYWALPPSTAKLEVAGMRMLREKTSQAALQQMHIVIWGNNKR